MFLTLIECAASIPHLSGDAWRYDHDEVEQKGHE
jgi:hypothetical protein